MQLPTSLSSDYSKAQAVDMSTPYSSHEPSKYPSPGEAIPYTLSSIQAGDNASLVAPAAMFPRFPPYDRMDIQQLPKPGYEPENLTTTEAFMRSYSAGGMTSCPNPYSPQDRIHPAVHHQGQRGFPGAPYPPSQAVMSSANTPGLQTIFPWMRSNISGE